MKPREASQPAELAVPVDQLHPEAHDQEQRSVRWVADRLVDQLHRADLGALLGHRPGSSTLVRARRTENLPLDCRM